MPDLNDLAILCAVVTHGSFRAAADFIGTSQPTVSRAIARLEIRTGQPLVRRNSRRVAPTELGRRYAERAARLLRQFERDEAEVLGGDEWSRWIRLSVPPALGRRVIGPALASFCEAHPTARLDLALENRRVDLLDEGVDIAVRFGPLAPTFRRQRRLLRGRYHVYGAAGTGRAEFAIDQLASERCLVLHSTHLRDRWPFLREGEPVFQTVRPTLKCNDVSSLIELVTLGAGVTLLPDFMVRAELERGDLVQWTADPDGVPVEVFAMTTEDPRSAPVEALLDHLVAVLAPSPEIAADQPRG